MKARKTPGGMFKKARPEKAEVLDVLVENLSISIKSARKIAKHVTLDRLREVQEMTEVQLKDLLAGCTIEIKKASDETEANDKFKEANEVIKVLKKGLREAVEPYQSSILLVSSLLEDKKDSQN